MEDIIMFKQVSKYLQMDEYTVYKLTCSGLIPFFKITFQWLFKKDIIDKRITEQSLERVAQNLKASLSERGDNLWLKKRSIQKQFIIGLKMKDHVNDF